MNTIVPRKSNVNLKSIYRKSILHWSREMVLGQCGCHRLLAKTVDKLRLEQNAL